MTPGLRLDQQVSPALRVQSYRIGGPERLPATKSVHRTIELTWLTAGRAQYGIGSRSLQVDAGCAILVPAGVEHVTESAAMDAASIKLEADAFGDLCDAFGSPRRPVAHVIKPQKIFALGRRLEQELTTASDDQQSVAEALCESIVIDAVRASNGSLNPHLPRDPRIRAAVDRIEACYAQPLTIADLAKTAGMSRFHFGRVFKEQLGKSPYSHLIAVRIARAAELLRRGRGNVTEVAFETGFQDLGRFSRAFRSQIGCRPSELLRNRGRAH